MIDYQRYINALRKCAKEHINDITPFAYIRVSELCRDTANLLELLQQEPVQIPEDATNGDVINAMFPSVEVKEKNNGYEVYFGIGTATQYFNHQWWNAPYKAESEDKE